MTRYEAIKDIEKIIDLKFTQRPVSLDMAIEALIEPTPEQVEEYCKKRCITLITNELFEEMMTRWSVSRSENQWIPVTNRPTTGSYLVTKRQKSGEIQIAFGNYCSVTNEWNGNGNFKEVLAYMPLPEPYKEGEQNETN